MGTPVDPVPAVARAALAAAADSPGYPATHGTRPLREAAAGWLDRMHGVTVTPDAILPVIGTKEFIAWLPVLLGCGPQDTVVYPTLAYPTYRIGALLAGAQPVAADNLGAPGAERAALVWVNSPSNPTGQVLPAAALAGLVQAARDRGAVLASDECYIDLGFGTEPPSVLRPECSGGSHHGLLAVYSMSKRSNLAGYRAGFVTGDESLISELLAVHKQAGMIVPAPVQAALTAVLGDEAHAAEQRGRYAARRDRLRAALTAAGWCIDHSEAGLYLWASHPAWDGWGAVAALAEAGILAAPGGFYGPAGAQHVRLALTATDERVESAAARLATLTGPTG